MDDVLHKVAFDAGLGPLAVLGGDKDLLDRHRRVAFVAYGDLALAVGPEVVDSAALADLRETAGQGVGERDGERHQLLRLLAGVAEHHALVAGADLVDGFIVVPYLQRPVHPEGDIVRLGVYGDDYTAGRGIEAELGPGVSDLGYLLAHQGRNVHVGRGGDLTRHDDEARGDERLAGHPAHRVVGEGGVEDGVGDLVRDLVRMAFGDGLGGKEMRGPELLVVCRVPGGRLGRSFHHPYLCLSISFIMVSKMILATSGLEALGTKCSSSRPTT